MTRDSIVLFFLLLAMLDSSSLFSSENPMSDTFGNTVVVSYPDGRIVKFFFEMDGTYRAAGGVQGHRTGTWHLNDAGDLCIRSGEQEFCRPLSLKRPGETWEQVSGAGDTIELMLVEGREGN